MKIGHVAAFLFSAGYLGFEAYAASKARNRMEAGFVYHRLVSAEVGTERCGDASPEQRAGFQKVVDRVVDRLRRELADAEPTADSAAIEADVERIARRAEAEAVAALDTEGCDSREARRYVRWYEIYARK